MSERKVKEKDIVLETTEKVLEEIMEAGYSESIVSINKSKTVMAKIANSQPSVIQDWDEVTVSMYLAKDKRIAVVNFETSSIEETVKLAKKMLSEISIIEESEYYAPIPKPKPAYVPFTVHRSILKAFEEPEKIIDNALSVAFTYDVDKVAGMLEITMGIRSLASSTGASLVEEYGAYEYYIRVFKGEGSGQWSSSGRIFREENIAEATRIAAEYAVESSKPESIEPGVYDVILSPMVMGNLLNVIGRMASALNVDMGFSIFTGRKIGEKVFSEKITLADDPINPESYGAVSFDAEGLPTRRNVIIENGTLKTLLHNSKTAAKHGVESTSNAGLISPHPWSLELKPGTYTLEELISEVKNGILVTNNWYTRLQNYIEGSFSTITRDALFLIKDGRIVKAAKKLRIADKLPRIFKNVHELGNKLYQIKWWEVNVPTFTPYVLIRNVHTTKHML